jgi:hypothetical protein
MPGNRLADYALTVQVGEPRAVMDPFPRPGQRAVFDRGEVRIEREDGEVLCSRPHPRAAFSGLSGLRRNLRWDPLDSAYFAGYAMWNYLTFPHLLTRPGVEASEGEARDEDGSEWRRLEVRFPQGFHTHSARQTFYLDARGLLRRHDYVAEPVGGWARAAHYCAEQIEVSGLVFPTRRRVVPIGRRDRPLRFPTLVSLELSELQVDAGRAGS